ncbi:secretory subunit [Elasticomyces elasticus]|nr:secretory subunit [Elasticomyces elasticus]
MSTDYSYDDQGQFFPFFFVTVAGLVTLPITYSLLRPSKDLENTAPRIQTVYQPKDADLVEGQRRKQKRRELKLKRMITAAIGWLTIAYMIYLMAVTTRSMPKLWDPYDILGVSRSSTEKQINSRYRKLSLTMHPDKARPDLSRNETTETINDRWVDIIKAHKALTDEDVRNNYIQYGNPDGKQSTSFGIALPKFLISEGNGKYVLLVYGSLLGVLLPYLVGKWWYGSQKVTKEKALISSAGNLFKEYNERTDAGGVVAALSSGMEYHEVFKGAKADSGTGKIESRVLSGGILSEKDRQKLEEMDDATRRKVLGLLWAYLGRIDLSDTTLNEEKYEVAPIALALNEAYISISLAFATSSPVLAAYHTSQNLIQALPPNAPPLLQLPYMTRPIIKAIEGDDQRTHMTIQRFMNTPEEQRLTLATKAGLDSGQYETAVSVAKQLPRLVVEKAFFKVTGERYILPSSLVQLVIKARFIPPGMDRVAPVANQHDLEDEDPEEGDLDAIHGRRKVIRDAQGKKTGVEPEQKPVQPPLAYAPYYPRDHSPRWHAFLADARQNKIAVPPFTFTTFDKPIFDETTRKPTYNVQTLKMQFQAPPHAGKYPFQVHLICDSYIGFDDVRNIALEVDEAAKAEESRVEEDEISEPEDDTIAGQMSSLRSGKVLANDDSSGSDTEGDEVGSETDTDTDTDEE